MCRDKHSDNKTGVQLGYTKQMASQFKEFEEDEDEIMNEKEHK